MGRERGASRPLGAHARRIEVVSSAARYDSSSEPRVPSLAQLLSAWRSRGLISAARKGSALLALALLGAAPLRSQDTICSGTPVVGP